VPVRALWIGDVEPVERSHARPANPVDKLGSTNPPPVSTTAPRQRPRDRAAGDRGFNRSSSSMSSASLVPVEKSGQDFHRLAAPTCPKSPIRSIPKYGSGDVRLNVAYLWEFLNRVLRFVLELPAMLCRDCFRAGTITLACGYRKVCRARDEVIGRVSKDAFRASGTLARSNGPINPRNVTAGASTVSCAG